MTQATRLGPGGYPIAAISSGGPTTYNQTVSPTTSSALGLAKQVAAIRTVSTSSTLTMRKAIARALVVSTSSALGLVKQARLTRSVATSGALTMRKALTKTLLASSAGVLVATALAPQRLVLTIAVSSTSAVAMVKNIASALGISTASASIVSSVLVLASRLKRAMLTLVGRQAGMLLSGHASRMALAGLKSQLELTGMSTTIDGKFHTGETWIINGLARDENGVPIDLTAATVQLRIVGGGAVVLDLATPAGGGVVVSAAAGTYRFLITPFMQTIASMNLTAYEYELRIMLPDSTVSVQNTGEITVKPSKFVN